MVVLYAWVCLSYIFNWLALKISEWFLMLYLLQSNHVVIHQINLNAGLVMTYLDIVVKKSQPKTGKLS